MFIRTFTFAITAPFICWLILLANGSVVCFCGIGLPQPTAPVVTRNPTPKNDGVQAGRRVTGRPSAR